MLLSHTQTNSRRAWSLPRARLKIHQVRSQVRSVEIERRSLVDWIRMPRGHANLSMILKISIRGH
jgi:hypothetical protein